MASPRLDRVFGALRGDSTRARALRASGLTLFSVVGSNLLRLLSNMVLTRLLYPEAFGLMALVQIFIYGLQTFSDIGIRTSIIQNKRGDDRDFLNTAWTLQILRGFGLWLGACALAWPAAQVYDQPALMLLLPATALSIAVDGFRPTREAQANRHLMLGRLTAIEFAVQIVTLLLTAGLAWWLRSVWALVWAAVIAAFLRNLLIRLWMPGEANRLHWDPASIREILGFGSFIFLSTIATFLINMGDRAILGAFVDTTMLGVYSIGLVFGALPGMVVQTVADKVLFPLYRMKPPHESEANRRAVLRARRMVSLVGILSSAFLGFTGVWLVGLLYDERYVLAGPILVLLTLRSVPNNTLVGTQNVLLAMGDSRRYFYLLALTAVLQTGLAYFGILYYGLAGAILVPGLAILLTYPLRAVLTARYHAWDPLGDALTMGLGFALLGTACALHWQEILKLLPA